MKKLTLALSFALACSSVITAAESITLPAPDKKGGKPLMQALTLRETNRNFTQAPISKQDTSNILYAAYGINRAKADKHTIPTAINMKNLVLYVTSKDGTFRYDPKANNKCHRACHTRDTTSKKFGWGNKCVHGNGNQHRCHEHSKIFSYPFPNALFVLQSLHL